MLLWRISLLLSMVVAGHCLRVYSSFFAPLFDPRILNYRVDAAFPPEGGRAAREAYEKMFGPRGANLIEDLGNGKGPRPYEGYKNYEDVKFYYTYPGAPR